MRAFEPLHPRIRIAALTVCGAGLLARGLAYVGGNPTGGLTAFADVLIPLQVWSAVWIFAGVSVLAGIWHRIIARWALSFGASMWAMWGLSFLWATVNGDSGRGWVTASTMLTLAGLMVVTAMLCDSVGPPEEPVLGGDAV